MPRMLSAMCPMIPVHQQVDDRAQAKKQVREQAEDVGPVLFPQEEKGNSQEQAKAQPYRNVQGFALCVRLGCSLHGILLRDQAAFVAGDASFIS